MTNEAWRALACICLRKALQIQAFENSPDFTSDKHAPAWCKKKCLKGTQNFFCCPKNISKFGKVLRRPCDIFLQQCPIKSRSRIFFATGRNVFVTGQIRDGVLLFQGLAKLRQTVVLGSFKSFTFQTLQFNANRVVVAVAAPAVV